MNTKDENVDTSKEKKSEVVPTDQPTTADNEQSQEEQRPRALALAFIVLSVNLSIFLVSPHHLSTHQSRLTITTDMH